ncbi:MAG: LysR family transcriptional regulator [Oscillospiraceae bacterium]|nr:LysR family transcriptional regulator [Oscillospiraceae bacterium]
MTFQQLMYVVEISKCGSINKAANKLFLSQSAISTAVHELETELNITLFNRTNKGVELTADGREFLGFAASLLEQKRQLESLYRDNSNLTVTTRLSVSTQRFPFTESAFIRVLQGTKDNRYRYAIRETGMDAVIDDVYDHRADLGVIYLNDTNAMIVSRLLENRGLVFHELAKVPLSVLVREGHPLARQARVTEASTRGYPYLSFEQAPGVSESFSEEGQFFSMWKPAKHITVSNRSTAINIMRLTDAFTTGSGLLDELVSGGGIVSLPLEGKPPVRVGYVAPKNSRLSVHAENFVHELEIAIADSIRYTESLRPAPRADAAPGNP